MTAFEQYLKDKGYIKFVLNMKTRRFEKSTDHAISTMVNLDHRYIHKDDKEFLEHIENNTPLTDIPMDVREREIIFGLREADKPATLIYPRPQIQIFKEEGQEFINQNYDDAMNIVLSKVDFDTIFEAMFNDNKIIKLRLAQ